MRLWPAWLEAAGLDAAQFFNRAATGLSFSNTHLALEAAMSGSGLVLAPHVLVAEDVAKGRLVRPFDIEIPDPFRFWLLCRVDRAEEITIKAWRQWLLQEVRYALD